MGSAPNTLLVKHPEYNNVAIEYELKREVQTVGSVNLSVDCLKDLDRTIDLVFLHLEEHGIPEALDYLCPYFGTVWPSAQGLAEFLSRLPSATLQGKRILELGCGLAIPSLYAAKMGAAVTATDYHPAVPIFLQRNLFLNQITNVTFETVDWAKEKPNLGTFDWVIGSDILYERGYAQSLAATLASQVGPGGKIVIADPGRQYLQDFVKEMEKYGFKTQTHIFSIGSPSPTEVFLFEFTQP